MTAAHLTIVMAATSTSTTAALRIRARVGRRHFAHHAMHRPLQAVAAHGGVLLVPDTPVRLLELFNVNL